MSDGFDWARGWGVGSAPAPAPAASGNYGAWPAGPAPVASGSYGAFPAGPSAWTQPSPVSAPPDYGAMFGGAAQSTRPDYGSVFNNPPPPPQPGQTWAAPPEWSTPTSLSRDYGAMRGALEGNVYNTKGAQPGAQPGGASGYNPSTDYYGMGTTGTYGATYKQPDWMRTAGADFMQDRNATNAFFAANPQYAEDWQRITSGGNSAFSTDGTSLIKSNFANMSPDAAAHYAQNPNELLAAEGFGMDPTLQYLNYYKGPGAIGVDGKRTNVTEFMTKNKWTPNGIVANNNVASLANTPFGAGYQSFLGAGGQGGAPGGAPGQPLNNKPMQIGGGGSSIGGGGSSTGGGYSGGGGGGMSSTGGQNPYSQTLSDMLASTMTNNWQRRIAPQLASQAVAAGGFGGSRQGVLEANSANDLNLGIGNALANLASNNFNTSANYDLGMANNALGYANLDRSINNDNLNWQLQGANLGMTMQDRMLAQMQMALGLGTNIQNTPINYWSQFANQYNGIGQGYGTTTGNASQSGNPALAALAGAQLGSRIGNTWGGGSNPSTDWFTGNRGMAD